MSKKVRTICAFLVLFLFVFAGFAQVITKCTSTLNAVLGDVNGDGKTGALDALWILQSLSEKRKLTKEQEEAADLNQDQKITAVDALILLRHISGNYQEDFKNENYYYITSRAQGTKLNSIYSSTSRVYVLTADTGQSDSHLFQIHSDGSGEYRIVCKNNARIVEVYDSSSSSPRLAILGTLTENQLWNINNLNNGFYSIINKKFNLALTIEGGSVSLQPYSGAENQQWLIEDSERTPYELVWSDEFNGPEIDKSIWKYEQGYIRNNELQIYTTSSKNSFIRDGCLVIRAIKENVKHGGKTYNYTSASLHTKGTKHFLYGRFEMRAKLPYGQAIWPAFWTMGVNDRWPKGGEMDIFEFWGGKAQNGQSKDGTISAAVWYYNEGKNQSWQNNNFTLPNGERFTDDFHVIAAEWDSEQLRFYIDGLQYAVLNLDNPGLIRGFTQPHNIKINLAVAPFNEYYGDASLNEYPQEYIIDYIRVYQQSE